MRLLVDQLNSLGFQRFASLRGRILEIDNPLSPAPAIYVAVHQDKVFWVGETGNLRSRFNNHRQWLALPDDSPRADARTRNDLLTMVAGETLVFFWKAPIKIFSELTGKEYSAHRVEEAIFIDYFQPPWNKRPGGRSRG